MINLVVLSGNLGRDSELRMTNGGTAKLGFTVATTSKWKDKKTGDLKETTQWHECLLWGKQAESLHRMLTKGAMVTVHGELTYRKYEDNDGKQRKVTEIRVLTVVVHSNERRGAQKDADMAERLMAQNSQEGYTGTVDPTFDDEIPF